MIQKWDKDLRGVIWLMLRFGGVDDGTWDQRNKIDSVNEKYWVTKLETFLSQRE